MTPRIAAFLSGLGLPDLPESTPIETWVDGLSEAALQDMGLDREHLAAHLHLLTQFTPSAPAATKQAIHTLTIAGGHGKVGQPEAESLVVTAGEIVCIVGPTG